MSNPYSAPSLGAAYDGSSTPDTDTVTYSWALHKNEIGDPLKTYMDSMKSAITTAFGLQAFNNVSSKSDNYTVLSTDQGALLVQTGQGKTFTLPSAASVGPNFIVAFLFQGGDTCTIDGATSETIDGATTLVMRSYNEWAILFTDGSSWYAVNSGRGPRQTAVLASDFTHSTPLTTDYETVTGFTANLQDDHTYRFRCFLEIDSGGVADARFRLSVNNVSGITVVSSLGVAEALSSSTSPDFTDKVTAHSTPYQIPAATATSCQAYFEAIYRIATVTGTPTFDLDCSNSVGDSSPIIVRKGSFLQVQELPQA